MREKAWAFSSKICSYGVRFYVIENAVDLVCKLNASRMLDKEARCVTSGRSSGAVRPPAGAAASLVAPLSSHPHFQCPCESMSLNGRTLSPRLPTRRPPVNGRNLGLKRCAWWTIGNPRCFFGSHPGFGSRFDLSFDGGWHSLVTVGRPNL